MNFGRAKCSLVALARTIKTVVRGNCDADGYRHYNCEDDVSLLVARY